MARVTLEELKARRPRLDRARIAATTEEDIREHMVQDGEDPDAQIDPEASVEVFPPRVLRMQLGLTEAAFAKALRIPMPTLEDWEQGRTTPDAAAQALFRIIGREPAAAMRALGIKRPRRRSGSERS